MIDEEIMNMKCTVCGGFIGLDHLLCTYCTGTFPKTYVGQLIADKWFLSLDELAKRTGTSIQKIRAVLKGEPYGVITERRLVKYLEEYEGEIK